MAATSFAQAKYVFYFIGDGMGAGQRQITEEFKKGVLKKDGKYSNMKGFIGGASFVFDNKFVLFGDIENLESKEKIIEHLKKYELELVDFKGLEVNDYGGAIIY